MWGDGREESCSKKWDEGPRDQSLGAVGAGISKGRF